MRRGTLFSSQPVSVVGVAASSLACQAGEAEAPRASTACLYAVRKGCGRGRDRKQGGQAGCGRTGGCSCSVRCVDGNAHGPWYPAKASSARAKCLWGPLPHCELGCGLTRTHLLEDALVAECHLDDEVW